MCIQKLPDAVIEQQLYNRIPNTSTKYLYLELYFHNKSLHLYAGKVCLKIKVADNIKRTIKTYIEENTYKKHTKTITKGQLTDQNTTQKTEDCATKTSHKTAGDF